MIAHLRKATSVLSLAGRTAKLAPAATRSISSLINSSPPPSSSLSSSSLSAASSFSVLSRSFASNPLSTKGSTSLHSVLANELMEEESNDEVEPELEVIRKEIEKTFTISETTGSGVVTLARKYKNEEVTITFDCQDESEGSIDEDAFYNQDEGADNVEDFNEEDIEEDMKYGINFSVSIKKGDNEMVLDCLAEQNLSVKSVRVDKAGAVVVADGSYHGPPFENLAEDVQDAFLNYLEDRKVDADLCHFILSYSQHKEQKEYVNWLKDLSKFTSS